MAQTKYQRISGLHEASLDGKDTVLLDVSSSKYYDLNPVAARIWQLLETPKTADELSARLLSEYQVDEAECLVQVELFIKQMRAKGICGIVGD